MQNVNLFEFGGNFAKLYRREEPRPAHRARLAHLAAVTAAKAVRAETVFWSVRQSRACAAYQHGSSNMCDATTTDGFSGMYFVIEIHEALKMIFFD